jgi:hypothetical protein
VTRKLTVNLGFRWDVNTPRDERFDRMNRGFDPKVVSPMDAMIDRTKFPDVKTIKGGMLFAGQNGTPHIATDLYLKTYQPRFGFAYALGRKTVIRGGWGRYYINPNNDFLQKYGFDASTPMTVSLDEQKTALANRLTDPFPTIIRPMGNSNGLMTYLGQGFNFINTGFETPYVNQFSFSIQRALTSRAKMDISYAGNRGYRQQTTKSVNEDDSSIRDQCNFLLGAKSQSYCTAGLTNPFKGLPGFEGTSYYTGNTVSRYNLNRPFPQFGALTQYMRNDAKNWYNGLNATFTMRAKGGVAPPSHPLARAFAGRPCLPGYRPGPWLTCHNHGPIMGSSQDRRPNPNSAKTVRATLGNPLARRSTALRIPGAAT